jgi:hypothetical protein
MMEEIQPHTSQINNPKYAVVLKKASFSWDEEPSVTHANGDLKNTKVVGQCHYLIFSSKSSLNVHLFHCLLIMLKSQELLCPSCVLFICMEFLFDNFKLLSKDILHMTCSLTFCANCFFLFCVT